MCQVRVQGLCFVGAAGATGFTGDPTSLALDNMHAGAVFGICPEGWQPVVSKIDEHLMHNSKRRKKHGKQL